MKFQFHVRHLIIFWIFMKNANSKRYEETKHIVQELIQKYNFTFGISTSAFQVEGAWNESGTGETMWGHYTVEYSERIPDHSNAHIACDSYHNLERDINMLKFLGVKFYRFSISWARLLPSPILHDSVSPEALKYYHNLIDQLKANNIIPVLQLFHYDMPKSVSDLGGWTNAKIIQYFVHFARIVFENFADKVDIWVTINQSDSTCSLHYGFELFPPVIDESGVAVYLCIKNMLLAHAKVYHLYKKRYNFRNKGIMGIITKMDWYDPITNSTEDLEFIKTFRKMMYGIYSDPIFSENGDYPEIVKKTVAKISKQQGFHISRLEMLTRNEVKYIRNTSDFFGLSYYTRQRIYRNKMDQKTNLKPQLELNVKVPSFFDDMNWYTASPDPTWNSTEIGRIMNTPQGLNNILMYIKETYNNPKVWIIENGCGTVRDTLDNLECVDYFKGHLNAIYDAVVNKGCNVHAYGLWGLMDNFDWDSGYTYRFGVFHTNFSDEKRSTKPKETANFVREILNPK